MPKKGDLVGYCDQFDADESYTPNTSVGIVTKVYNDAANSLDLVVFFSEGFFVKKQVPMGSATTRMTWFAK